MRRRRDLARGDAMGAIVLAAVLAVGLSIAGSPTARAMTTTDECPPTTSSAPAPATTPAPTTAVAPVPAPVPVPVPTPEPTPTPTPTPTPVPTFAISGTVTRQGQQAVITDPPGDYSPEPPTNPPAGVTPGTTWSLPTVAPDAGPMAGATISLLDDAGNVVATTTTDAAGGFQFTGQGPGNYTVRVDAVPDPGPVDYGLWFWMGTDGVICEQQLTRTAWTLPAPAVANVTTADVTGIALTTTNTVDVFANCTPHSPPTSSPARQSARQSALSVHLARVGWRGDGWSS